MYLLKKITINKITAAAFKKIHTQIDYFRLFEYLDFLKYKLCVDLNT